MAMQGGKVHTITLCELERPVVCGWLVIVFDGRMMVGDWF